MRTKRISRQLKKVFGDEAMENSLVALGTVSDTEQVLGALRELVGKFPDFLNAVEETYQQLEDRANIAQRSMEVSAVELTEANSRLFRLNQTFDAMVNSLGQGFVIFGKDGICQEVYSMACEDLLEAKPAGRHIAEVLGVHPGKREALAGWMEILFADTLDFAEFSKLGPTQFAHSKGKKVSIEFKPVRGSSGQIDFVMAIATDFTKEFEANERAREMKAHATLVTSILKNRERFTQFIPQFRSLLGRCMDALTSPANENGFLEVKQHLHGLKGAAGSFGMLAIQTKIHGMETEIAKRESLKNSASYLLEQIPMLCDLFERTLEENADVIGNLPRSEEPQREVSLAKLLELEKLLASGKFNAQELRAKLVDDLISVPCANIFSRFDSVIQETAVRLGKKVKRIAFTGEDVRVIPERYPNLCLNLAHVFRNIVDHGIESVEEREAAGKDGEGHVSVTIRRAQNDIVEIRIADDGRGIDVERIKQKLREMGRGELAEKGSREEILDTIFMAGLSTAQTVTEISGRGIGLNAVRESLAEHGGSISVQSVAGKGTTMVIRLPLNLAHNSDSAFVAPLVQSKV
jgi:two-component system, chemotaxis family, sensor kinase CheA